MDSQEIKVAGPVTVTPIGVTLVNAQTCTNTNCSEDIQSIMQETANATQQAFENLSEDEKTSKAKAFLKNFNEYISSKDFAKDVNATAKKYGIPPKKLAQNFFEKALGTVGDILGIAISVVCNGGRLIIRIIGTVANAIVDLIQSFANGIARIATLNKTCLNPAIQIC